MVRLPLTPESIQLDVDVPDSGTALALIARSLSRICGEADSRIESVLRRRESQGSTGLGYGVAIPHARLDGVSESVIAVLRSKSPVPFGAPDGTGVRLFIGVLVPASAMTDHLEILSAVAARLSDDKAREALFSVPDPQTFIRILTLNQPNPD